MLKKRGYDVEFIDFRSNSDTLKNLLTACQIEHRHKHPISMVRGITKYIAFKRQLKEYPHSKKITKSSQLMPEGYDVIIIGSDEIINLNHPLFDNIYYGVGINNSIPLILFSVSAGTVDKNTELSLAFQKSLKRFVALSARDINTIEFLKNNIDRDVIEVLDPTFLYDFSGEEYEEKLPPYILIYSFGFLKDYSKEIMEYANQNGLLVLAVGQVSEWADKSIMKVDLHRWLGLYKNAQLVVTDSYHGFIFAMKYRKEYILINKADKTNKIDGLLFSSGAERGYYQKGQTVTDYLLKPVNFDKVEKNLEILKNESLRFLIDAIEQTKKG